MLSAVLHKSDRVLTMLCSSEDPNTTHSYQLLQEAQSFFNHLVQQNADKFKIYTNDEGDHIMLSVNDIDQLYVSIRTAGTLKGTFKTRDIRSGNMSLVGPRSIISDIDGLKRFLMRSTLAHDEIR